MKEENKERKYTNNDPVFSKIVKAGKRTYFFDVKKTRNGEDYVCVITESRKSSGRESSGRNFSPYQKVRLFLYKEDLNKFEEALKETTTHIKEKLLPDFDF